MAGYKRGDVIMRNRPWAYVLDEKHALSYCHYCFRRPMGKEEEALKRCTQCLFAHYCGPVCAKSAWKDHKVECKRLLLGRQSSMDIPESNIRLLARIMSKLKRGERADPLDACSPPTERTYDSLCTHADKIESSVIQITAFTYTIEKVVAFLGEENMLKENEAIKDAYSKLIVNAMTLYDGSRPYGIGAALPLGATRFDHACKPNADYMIRNHSGCEIVITALEDIPSIDGVRICYCNSMDMTPQRQITLKEHYYFLCQCEWCLDEDRDNMMRSIRCPEPFCGGTVPLTSKFLPKPCKKCNNLLTGNDSYVRKAVLLMGKVNDTVAEYTSLFEGSDETDTKLLRKQKDMYNDVLVLYSDIKAVLMPLNVFYIKLIVHLADHESELGWKSYLEETDAYRYYHGFSSFFGIRLVLQGGYQMGAGLLDAAARSLDEAEKIVKVTHGADHPMYKDMLNVKYQQLPQLQRMKKMARNLMTK